MIELVVNGASRRLRSSDSTPLLVALREELGLRGTKFGCGAGFCGACTVHVDGVPTRSCLTEVGTVAGRAVTTIEGLGGGSRLHALQRAWIEQQVPACGYALVAQNPELKEAGVDAAMQGVICRCMQ